MNLDPNPKQSSYDPLSSQRIQIYILEFLMWLNIVFGKEEFQQNCVPLHNTEF